MRTTRSSSVLLAAIGGIMWQVGIVVEGIDTVSKLGQFNVNAVTPDYFATMGTRILRGRGIADTDAERSPRVAMVSEGMARTLWPGRDAIGPCRLRASRVDPSVALRSD